jgi:hypothetical protein
MYHILNFYTIVFFKFIIYEMNSKMIKYRMVVLIERGKTDVTDADVTVGLMLQASAETLVGGREREN